MTRNYLPRKAVVVWDGRGRGKTSVKESSGGDGGKEKGGINWAQFHKACCKHENLKNTKKYLTKYHKVDIAVTGAPQLLPKQIFLLNSFMKLGPAKESSGV